VAVAVIEGTARIVSAISERNSNLDYLPTVMQKVFDTLVESLAAHS
jgi:nitroimidazol reductase NimA-like FMN-containing flavoprotein (pyridoxamine 5'-phosphate oxidase superfamily)